MMAEVKELNPDGDIKKVVTDKGTFETLGIVLATGASPRKIGFEGEIKYQGRGVAYCATCDGEFLRDWMCLSWEEALPRQKSLYSLQSTQIKSRSSSEKRILLVQQP